MPGGKVRQNVYRIVADRINSDPVAIVFWKAALQLNELRFAEWSPPRAAVEYYQGTTARACGMKIDDLTVLVRQRDIGEAAFFFRTDSLKIVPT
jgi:hypothetical protein